MNNKEGLQFTNGTVIYPLLLVFVMWIVYWVEIRFHINLNFLGIYPRTLEGLQGIIFAPFIHGGLQHIFNNSIPLFVLGVALFYFYGNVRWKVILFGLVITGFLTWCIGRPSLHIGASGVVYMLAAFLFFRGIFSKQYQLTALSFAVVFLYGGLLWYVFPIDAKISWEGHLSGFFVGFAFSFFFKENAIETKKYAWEEESYNPDNDPFLKHFDTDGNFIEKLPEPVIEAEKNLSEMPSVKIIYTIKKDTPSEGQDL